MRYWVWIAACAVGLAGCESTTLQRDTATENNGIGSYALPRASLNVAVFYARDAEADGLIVAAEMPKIVTGEILPLTAKFSGWSKDEYRVEVDPKTGFLKKISIGLDDRGPEITKAAAESLGAIASLNPGFLARVKTQSAALESEVIAKPDITQIAEATFDPTDASSVRDANVRLWSEVLDYTDIRAGLDCRADQRRAAADARAIQVAVDAAKGVKAKAAARKKKIDEIAAHAPVATFCNQPNRLVPADARGLARGVAVSHLAKTRPLVESPQAYGTPPEPQVSAGGGSASVTPAAPPLPCAARGTAGVCVRAAKEMQIALKAPAGPTKWRTARLPAIGQETLVNIDRAIMADKSLAMDFTDGTPGDREISQDSAAENIASLPKVVIDAAIDSVGKTTTALSNIIPIRIEYRSLRRPDEEIEVHNDEKRVAEDGGASGEAAAGASEASKPAEAKPTASTPPATPTTTISVPGPAGAGTTITITNAAPPAKEEATKPAAPLLGSQLWFASCAYGLICRGGLEDQLMKGSSQGASELPQGDATSGATGAGSGQSPGRAQDTAQADGVTNSRGGASSCKTAEDLKKRECRAVTG